MRTDTCSRISVFSIHIIYWASFPYLIHSTLKSTKFGGYFYHIRSSLQEKQNNLTWFSWPNSCHSAHQICDNYMLSINLEVTYKIIGNTLCEIIIYSDYTYFLHSNPSIEIIYGKHGNISCHFFYWDSISCFTVHLYLSEITL